MGELRITDLVDAEQIKLLNDLNQAVQRVKTTYAGIGKELVMGLKIDVETKGDLDKLNTIVASSAKKATESSKLLNEALQKQHELSEQVAQSLDRMAKSGQLSAKDAKTLADASKKNAEALEKEARAEATLEKARNSGNKSRKDVVLTEEERKRALEEAIALSKKDVHSIAEAEAANKRLRAVVKEVTDAEDKDGKIRQQLNSAINVNTNYIKRNRDELTRSKMTVGDYKEQIKLALNELRNHNDTMKNMGIVAKGFGGIMRSTMNEVQDGVSNMIKGFVGAQAIIGMFLKLKNAIVGGFKSIIDFEAEVSKLAAILGTTSQKIKELDADARRLGASTRYTASEVVSLQIELAKLGFTRNEILQTTESVLKFAQATGSELSEAAALAGASIRMYGANASESARYVSAMAVATTKSALSFNYLSTAMPIVGPVAKAFNFTIEDTLALLGKLADSGFDASMAATATRNIFLNLADSGGKLATALGKPVTNLPELVEGLRELKERGIDLNETLELTDKRSVAAMSLFIQMADSILPLREQVTGVTSELEAMANTMADNVKGAMLGLESAWESVMLSFSNSTGVAKDVINFLSKGLREVAKDFKTVEQMQEDLNNNAVSNASKEMADSDYVKKHSENLKNLYKEYIELGYSSKEAQQLAKDEYIESLNTRLQEEGNAYKIAIEKRQALEKELEERGLFETITSLSRTNNVIKDEIETAAVAAAGKKAIASITESLIEQLNKIDLIGTQNKKEDDLADNTDANIEKKRQAAEKAAKERQKIEQQLQDANIAIMEDGLEKEIATISTNYNRKIAAIKGNSEQEKELRKTLGVLMQKEIADAKRKHQEKLDEEQAKRDEQAMQEKADRLLEQSEIEATNISTSQILANTELEDAYKQGLIDREEYEKEKFELQKHYNEMALRNTIETAKAMIALMPDGADKDKAIAKLREQMAKLKEVMSSEFGGGDDDKEWGAKTWKEKWSEAIEFVSESFNGVVDLIGGMTDRRIQELEREIEANEKAGDKELERIQHLADTGVFTTEEAEARKRAAEERTAAKTEELERKKAALQTRQAKLEKAANIASVIMNTATAIMKAWGQAGIFGAPMAALIGAMGAIQLATVIAQPIPKYAKGTDDHPGGFAIVGDGGRSEAVMTKDGVWFTPSVPTLVNLPEHAIVYPDAKDLPNDDFPEFSAPFVMRGSGDSSATTIINDYSKLEKKVDATNALLAQGFRNINRDSSYRNLQMYMMSRL